MTTRKLQARLESAWVDQKAGRLDEAEAEYRRVLYLAPQHPVALQRLGLVAHARGNLAEAERLIRLALEVVPGDAVFLYTLGIVLQDGSKPAEAASMYRRAIERQPGLAAAHFNLGLSLAELGRLQEAADAFAQAIALKPDHAAAHANRADALMKMGAPDLAAESYRELARLQPRNLAAALNAALTLPLIHDSPSAIAATRARYAQGLERLENNLSGMLNGSPEALCAAAERVNFHLAYQGENDRELQERYARIVSRILEKAAAELLDMPRPRPRTGAGKIRVGFASFFFWRTSVGSYFGSWPTGLDRARFETFVYHLGPIEDQVTRSVRDGVDVYRHLQEPVLEIARRIREDALDVLVFPELGMNGKAFLLAAMRLAPVQCAAWGHPVTSGLASIDYHLSCAEMEPADGAGHYSETLIVLPGIGTCYAQPALPEIGTRGSLGLPDGRYLYLFPQSLFKIHPDNDRLLAEVLSRDPDGTLVMFRSGNPFAQAAFRARLDPLLAEYGVSPQRVMMLPFLTHDDYLRVNMHADVMLDCLHWSGGNTSLDAIAAGLPIVTLPGRFMRARQSAGMLSRLELPELIARDQADYVNIALRLGCDKPWREEMSRRIVAGHGRLFDDPEPVAALESFLLAAQNMRCGV
ncbi:MAG: tetratricopeptide repeat protein [Sulfuricaulis sp.]|nr:tetratricopeptide repeat protein [Sulfuricaulis sp.]